MSGKGKRRSHSAAFKAKVAVEAIKGQRTANELGSAFEVHPKMVATWKKQAIESMPEIFMTPSHPTNTNAPQKESELYEQIGRLKMELEWLKKKAELINS